MSITVCCLTRTYTLHSEELMREKTRENMFGFSVCDCAGFWLCCRVLLTTNNEIVGKDQISTHFSKIKTIVSILT